jgi:hypothetical protein
LHAWVEEELGRKKNRSKEGKRIAMTGRRRSIARISAMLAMACLAFAVRPASAQHACDAAEEGHRLVATVEIAGVEDSAPYRAGADWVVDRTTTRLPMCSYFTPVGSYSLRSYSLDPVKATERVTLCHGDAAVAPYAGPCPPK